MTTTAPFSDPAAPTDLELDVARLEVAFAAPSAGTLPLFDDVSYRADVRKIDAPASIPFAARLAISLFAVLAVAVPIMVLFEALGLQR
ncbi:MAG: hypothetical protein H7287_08435 [Thermoleophilia bacterium]|nr:hypothetical protein [Thermoleophilia bacterium]